MGLLFRKCTSFRIRGSDLYQKVPYGYQQRVTNGLEFGNTRTALTPVKRDIDTQQFLASKTLRGQQYRNALWRVGREFRSKPEGFRQTIQNGNQAAVANSLFWGTAIYGVTLGIYVSPKPGTILVPTTSIIVHLITVLNPPIATVLFNPANLHNLLLTLGITRPSDFMPPSGGGGQFGYGG
jgi:hypothetical protein